MESDRTDLTRPAGPRRVQVTGGGIEIRRRGVPARSDGGLQSNAFLVIDCSGSMAGRNLESAKKGAIDFAESALTKGYTVGLVQFADTATLLCQSQVDLAKLRGFADTLVAGGATEMARGIAMADRELRKRPGQRAMVIVTDGLPNRRRATMEAARLAKRNSIDIIAIGTGEADHAFLSQIASRVELSVMVPAAKLAAGIRSSAGMLPGPVE